MRKKLVKRVISLLMVSLMLASLPLYSNAATSVTPVIMVTDITDTPIYLYPNTSSQIQEFPPNVNTDVKFAQYLSTYIAGMDQGHYELATLAIFPEVMSWFENIRCNFDGTSVRGGMGVLSFNDYDADGKIVAYPMSTYMRNPDFQAKVAGEIGLMYAEAVGQKNLYVYSSDWRLDPIQRGSELADLVQQVKEQTGSKKVNIISQGTGSIVASVYLDKYADVRDIKNFVTIESAARGTSIIGDLFTGEIDADPNGIIRFVNDLPDNVITASAFWLAMRILNDQREVYDVALHIDLYLIAEKNHIYDSFVRDFINKIPGLWAMMPYSYYDDAMAFMYPAGYQDINLKLKSSLDEYHAIQGRAEETLYEANKAGVNVAVVSGYGMQNIPFTTYATVESGDGFMDTRYSSYGAETAFLNDSWVGKGLKKQINDDGHDHTDRSKNLIAFGGITVDASTCILPESTWFIYGLKHGYWESASDSQYYFLTWLGLSNEQRTIRDDPYYPQFMRYNRFSIPGEIYGRNSRDYLRFTLLGDTDLNGVITANDARLALRHSARLITLTRAAFRNGDINGDGKITAAEARKILRVSARLDTFDTPQED